MSAKIAQVNTILDHATITIMPDENLRPNIPHYLLKFSKATLKRLCPQEPNLTLKIINLFNKEKCFLKKIKEILSNNNCKVINIDVDHTSLVVIDNVNEIIKTYMQQNN
jgi:hypothetical protein